MNYIDYIILCIIIIFVLKGLFRGLIVEVIGLVGQLVSVILATKLMSNVSEIIGRNIDSIPPAVSTIIGFLTVFIAVHMVFQLIAHILQKFVKYTFLGWLEKLAGGMVGFTKGAIITSLFILLITIVPMSNYLLPDQDKSVLLKPIGKFAPKMFNYLTSLSPNSKNFKKEIMESLDGAKSNFNSKEAYKAIESFFSNDEDSK